MKKVKGQPITGAKRHVSHKAPLVPDAKDTSANAQAMIAEAPMPFKNRMSTAQMPAGAVNSNAQASGVKGSAAGYGGSVPRGPIGQKRPINQSGQVYGPRGVSHPRHVGRQNLGKTRKHASFYAE